MSKEMDEAIDKFYEKTIKGTFEGLLNLIEEQIDNPDKEILTEERFSFAIDLPKFTPTEAWGDPGSQDRDHILKVFSVVRGGRDMRAKIADINKFLDPAAAKRKRSPGVILNMMMIVESLQATLNDFNESAAGFVFEGFMAALTGGKQIAGKVGGTLPIEDFVAFSDYGEGNPVSLKLLSPTTGVKGSFTNIVDFLLDRGAPAIKYLVAYKLVEGENVEKLNIFDFDITTENFIDFIVGTKGQNLLEGVPDVAKLKSAMVAYAQSPSKDTLLPLAQMMTQAKGYTKSGLLHKFLQDRLSAAEREKAISPEDRDTRVAKKQAQKRSQFTKQQGRLDEEILAEAKDSQWEASFPQLVKLKDTINMQDYGTLDLSKGNITNLTEIYSEKLKGGVTTLLTEAKKMTENIGTYYREKRRSKATAAASEALESTNKISNVLEEDPRYSK